MLNELLRAAGWDNGNGGYGNRFVGAPLAVEPTDRSPSGIVPPSSVRFDDALHRPSDMPDEESAVQALEPLPASPTPAGEAAVIDYEPHAEQRSVVHETLKGLDVWFGYQVSGLEKEALRHATTWAEKGLPRHDLDVNEPIEVEKDLANRAAQIYWQWVREVRRRMNGAVSRQVTAMGTALSAAHRALEHYRQAQQQLARLNPRN